MTLTVIAPLLLAIVLAVGVTTAHRWLPPVTAARSVAITVVVVVAAAVPTLLIVTIGFLAHVPFLGVGFTWCAKALGVHEQIPTWAGLPALLLTLFGAIRVTRVVRTHRRLRHDRPGSVEIAGHDQPFAFTLPGRGGHVVLSSGLIELLDNREQSVVLAHEAAHARHRHDRYLLVAHLSAAAIPMLRPLSSRLRYSLERWADEAAVDQCGDRRFVACTLGKVALNSRARAGALGFGDLGVPARVAALLAPPVASAPSGFMMAMWSAISATGALALFQLHHLAGIVTALCPG